MFWMLRHTCCLFMSKLSNDSFQESLLLFFFHCCWLFKRNYNRWKEYLIMKGDQLDKIYKYTNMSEIFRWLLTAFLKCFLHFFFIFFGGGGVFLSCILKTVVDRWELKSQMINMQHDMIYYELWLKSSLES